MDPVMVEVLRNELAATSDEMSLAIRRVARSPMVRMGDFATAVADRDGYVVEHPKVHAAVILQTYMTHIVKEFGDELAEGDVVIGNFPYAGASHKPDVFVVCPAFLHGVHVGYATSWSHQVDIGGRFAGGTSSHCSTTYEEGIHFPNVRLYRQGVLNEEILKIILSNVRQPEDFIGDLDAKISGCRKGAAQLAAIYERYGSALISESLDAMRYMSEKLMKAAIRRIPDGSYHASVVIPQEDDGSVPQGSCIKLTLEVSDDSMVLDFTGTSRQLPNALNLPVSNALGVIVRTVEAIVAPMIPVNVGFLRPVTIVTPEGSVLNPSFPAAVGGRTPLFFVLAEAVHNALAQAMPTRVPVPPEGADAVYISSTVGGRSYAALDVTWGGWGARPHRDGVDGVSLNSSVAVPAEVLERTLPVVVREVALVPDSAGAGRFRGSMAVRKSYRFLADATVLVRTNRPHGSADGYAGGKQGLRSSTELIKNGEPTTLTETSHLHLDVSVDDVLTHTVGGTSGYGPPDTRDPELVRRDVIAGKVSVERALSDYKVALSGDDLSVNRNRTNRLRRKQG